MEKNENKKIKIFSNLKQQKILELQKKRDEGKSVNEKKEKVNRNLKELVVHTKESENRKKRKRKSINFFLFAIFTVMSLVIVFLSFKYKEFQVYLSKNKDIINLGKKYEEEQKRKAAEIKDLKNLTLGNINDLPDDKKKLMLNIIPSGSPLKRELYVTLL